MNRFHRWYCRTGHWQRAIQGDILPWVLADIDLGEDVLEIGPGPGLTTEVLVERTSRLTAVEIDRDLADQLRSRLMNVTVTQADASDMPFPAESFSGVVACTMLHHIPSSGLQDAVLREAHRVLRPGGVFVGSDSLTSPVFRLAHVADTMTLVEPATFADRLSAAGFEQAEVKESKTAFRFRAVRTAVSA